MKLKLKELELLGQGKDNTGELADGTWKLLWTTEQVNLHLPTCDATQ